jgi:ribonucleoside-diphosphate reductase alpha chain
MSYQFLQPISEEIFQSKYNLYDEESPEAVLKSIAKEISFAEETEEKQLEWEKKFYEELESGRLIPAGRILANARTFSKMKNYNNCFTIDIEDSMEGIFDSLAEDARISKMGGGVGFDVSKLRPKNTPISKGGESSGPVSFLKIFDSSAKTVHTGGNRRSAHIALMEINHPDIEEFITTKQGETNKELTQFNISVKITDDFMQAVEDDAFWDLKWGGKTYRTVKARHIYDMIAKNAFQHNEPGIFFSDTVERYNNGYWAFKLDRVNPCGEIVMPAYSLCCLSAINLSKFVVNEFTEEAYFDYPLYQQTIRAGIRFLDNVLDRTEYPLDKIKDFSEQWRRIGLGITGLGDALTMLGISYGSKESISECENMASTLMTTSYGTSVELAKEKGAFPAFDSEKFIEGNFIKEKLPVSLIKEIKENGIRNVAMNTIAPTGTTSFSLGNNCSSGVEPIFSLGYERNIRTGKGEETKKEKVSDYAWLLYQEKFGEGCKVPPYFVTTAEIGPYQSIDIQAIWQKYIDHSISKTLNLPPGTTQEEYNDLFKYAFKKGLKGFTTFNPGGSMKGVLEYSKPKEKDSSRPAAIERVSAPKRPTDLECDIYQISVNKERHIVLVGRLEDGSIYEVFVTTNEEEGIDIGSYTQGILRKAGKNRYQLVVKNGKEKIIINNIGKVFNEAYSTLSRFISMSLRHGVDLAFIVDQLVKGTSFISFERSLSRVLKKYIKDGEKVKTSKVCPECGSDDLSYREGCLVCVNCGFGKCD